MIEDFNQSVSHLLTTASVIQAWVKFGYLKQPKLRFLGNQAKNFSE
jgi:hypothetical protein